MNKWILTLSFLSLAACGEQKFSTATIPHIVKINGFKTRCSIFDYAIPGVPGFEPEKSCLLVQTPEEANKNWMVNEKFRLFAEYKSSNVSIDDPNRSKPTPSIEEFFQAGKIVTVRILEQNVQVDCKNYQDCPTSATAYKIDRVLNVEDMPISQYLASSIIGNVDETAAIKNTLEFAGARVSIRVCYDAQTCNEIYSGLIHQTTNAATPKLTFNIALSADLVTLLAGVRQSAKLQIRVHPLAGTYFGEGYWGYFDSSLQTISNPFPFVSEFTYNQ